MLIKQVLQLSLKGFCSDIQYIYYHPVEEDSCSSSPSCASDHTQIGS